MIAIIDYGLGNITAFANIYKRLGVPFKLASSPDDLVDATKIILPGVGAFDHAMKRLLQSGMRDRLDERVLGDSVPVLGICVGMQIMAESSAEGNMEGLGWIKASVKKIPQDSLRSEQPLPHMGWNTIQHNQIGQMFQHIPNNARFYFLHSYYLDIEDEDKILATAAYGRSFCCVVGDKNIMGMQCHPEKSHGYGVQFLKNFSEL